MLNHAYINLNTLRENAAEIKSKLKKGAKLCAVVKANAYGHGICEVANAVYSYADMFAVAIKEEASALRLSGIKKDILMLIPAFDGDIDELIDLNVILSVGSLSDVKRYIARAKAKKRAVRVHIAFNSGMNRLGADLEELKQILQFCKDNNHIRVEGMFSHLACPENKKMTKKALDKFLLANKLVKGYNNNAICHLSASGGYLLGLHFDMVRIGILLYGYKPFKSDYCNVKRAMFVYSPVICERKVKRHSHVLYGKYKTSKTQKISLVRFGYADGLPRKCVKGQINNRCMDMSALERSRQNDAEFYEILSDADILAKKYKTISYEILTSVTVRAQRIYIN